MKIPSPFPLLQRKFPPGEYALLPEVSDEAGRRNRSADAVAMNTWPSRGLEVHGIEIKSYRSDWIKELKNPAKAENIFQYCDRWWICAAAEDVVKENEVPETWGFLLVKNGRIYTIKEAPKLSPQPLTKTFIASMLKRASQGMVPRASIQEELEIAEQKGRTTEREIIIRERNGKASAFDKLKLAVDTFKEITGIDIQEHEWRIGKVGAVVELLIRDEEYATAKARVKQMHETITELQKDIAAAMEELK